MNSNNIQKVIGIHCGSLIDPSWNPPNISTAKRTPEVIENTDPVLDPIPTITLPTTRAILKAVVLIEERGPSVTRRAVPRGTERRVKGAASPKSVRRTRAASRLVGKINIVLLSFDLELRIGWSAIGKLKLRPSLAVPKAAALSIPKSLWMLLS